jgi:hypothetical protein
MNNGWIKLHRKLLDNPLKNKPAWAWLWIVLLLLANHDEKDSFIWNNKKINLEQGQFITGRKKLNEITGIPETTIERILNYLESEHQIGQQKTKKYRLITIVKWKDYQKSDNKSDNRRTTDGQQTDTFKNVKKDKNDKKENTSEGIPSQDIQTFINLFKGVNPSYEMLFRNKTERDCSARLLKKYGIEKMTRTIEGLPDVISQPYAPKITTPYELERNLGKLLVFLQQNKNIISKNQPAKVLMT